MNKQEFINGLKQRLPGLPAAEIDARVEFYAEMIDDRIEEGASEEEAVAAVGSMDEVVREILAQIPLGRLVKHKVKRPRKPNTTEIVLLALGSPLWVALLLGVLGIVLGVVAAVLGGIIGLLTSLWAISAALVACGFAGVPAGVLLLALGRGIPGVGLVGASLACLGLSIFAFCVSKIATKAVVRLFKKGIIGIKHLILKGGRDRA